MISAEVLNLYNWLNENGIAIWIDGGWGVDALLGKQTREHADLDIAVHRKDNANLRKLLENNYYNEDKRDDSSEFMYVMKSRAGISIDIHVFEYDESGKNTYGIEYPFGSLTGTGIIDGQELIASNQSLCFGLKPDISQRKKTYTMYECLVKNSDLNCQAGTKNRIRTINTTELPKPRQKSAPKGALIY